jgi:serine/threonine protein kinase/Tol biopolymer transport system component
MPFGVITPQRIPKGFESNPPANRSIVVATPRSGGQSGELTLALSTGDRIGPYEIVSLLGEGGMGEVYRARDPRLAREVALKILPASFSSDRERLRRFERESRAASALSHPSIVTVYDVGSEGETSYIVMELVQGRTLRELLLSGPLPLRKLLPVAAQLSDGLSAAHEAGIVHRDLKPENVMVTRDGGVKILDFGLAKLGASAGSGERGAATISQTEPGGILGTVGYMSPEQAAGHAVDFRSDQFSLGSILFEMVTGEKAFQKEHAVDTLSAILHEEPAGLATFSERAPVPLPWIIERCLAKDPAERFASTRDLARDLARLRQGLSATTTPGPRPAERPPLSRRSILWAGLGLAAGAGVASLLPRRREAPPLYHKLTFRPGAIFNARFGPDGQTIVYTGIWEGDPARLYSTRADSTESTALPFPGAGLLSISRSGRLALNLADKPGVLAEASIAGGGMRELLENVDGADWSPDREELVVSRSGRLEYPPGKVLYDASAAAGTPAPAMEQPRFSPDGKRVAFFQGTGEGVSALRVVDLGGEAKTLARDLEWAFALAWNPNSSEVWYSAHDLSRDDQENIAIHAVSLSGRHRIVSRQPPNLVVQDVAADGRVLLAQAEFPRSMVFAAGGSPPRDLSWRDFSHPVELADDAAYVLFDDVGSGNLRSGGVYLRKTDGSPAIRLGAGRAAALSPDRKWALAIPSARDGFVLLPTGPGESRSLPSGGLTVADARWFPDGRRILFQASAGGGEPRLYVRDADAGEPRAASPPGFTIGPVSPDGKVAAVRDRNESNCLLPLDGGEPRPFPAARERRVLRWDATGRFLFVAGDDAGTVRIERLAVSTGDREPWNAIAPSPGASPVDVCLSADGKSAVFSYVRVRAYLYVVEGLR